MVLNLNDNFALLLLLLLLGVFFFSFFSLRLSLIQTFMRLLNAGDFQNLLSLVILNNTPSFIINGFWVFLVCL